MREPEQSPEQDPERYSERKFGFIIVYIVKSCLKKKIHDTI